MEKQRIAEVLFYLPERIRRLIIRLAEGEWMELEEIRLRSGAPRICQRKRKIHKGVTITLNRRTNSTA